MGEYRCVVCGGHIDSPHTYHDVGCPRRDDPNGHVCAELSNCGQDCHPECCPTCTGQEFHPQEVS